LLDAHRDFLEAVTLARQADSPPDLIQALKGLGQIERDLDRGDAARPHTRKPSRSAAQKTILPSWRTRFGISATYIRTAAAWIWPSLVTRRR
jgi:hypothetical protein